MSPLRLRRALRRSRHRLAMLVVLACLSGAVAVHHGMPSGMHAMPGQAICLAMLAAGALLAIGAVLVTRRADRSRPVGVRTPRALVALTPRSVPARAGPLYLRLAVLRL